MPFAGFYVDANLLVLLVVGNVDTKIIAKHRRLEDYSTEHYEILLRVLGRGNRVFVTAHTLAEASNLLGQHGEPERSILMQALSYLIDEAEEVVIESARAAASPEFVRLGLTDSALLEVINPDTPLVTADVPLYVAALQRGHDVAMNFWEYTV